MAHMYYGDPTEQFSLQAMKLLCENGVDILEFGIPFSDPNADGPVFQRSCERALKAGMTPKLAITGIEKLRNSGIKQPIVVTSYYNPILQMGIEHFIYSIKQAGADALIVPNTPFEESDLLLKYGKKHGINIIFLIAPTTPFHRLKEILSRSQGFLYVVSVTGVTGVRDSLEKSTIHLIQNVRKYTNIPLLVGFGISSKEQAKTIVSAGATGVITGSVIGRTYEQVLSQPEKSFPNLTRIVKEIKQGCQEGSIQCERGNKL